MELPGEIVGALAAGIPVVLSAFAVWIKRGRNTVDQRVNDAQRDHKKALVDSEERCREETRLLVMRVQHLEERSHTDGRTDRDRMLDIIAQHGEAQRSAATIGADGNKALARALEKLAERLPSTTPPHGSKT